MLHTSYDPKICCCDIFFFDCIVKLFFFDTTEHIEKPKKCKVYYWKLKYWKTFRGSRKKKNESRMENWQCICKYHQLYLHKSQNIFVYITNGICPNICPNYKIYLSRIWSRKGEGEKGKQLSVRETGALITEVAPLVSTKEPKPFWGHIFNFFSCANCSPNLCLFGEGSEICGAPNLIISMCNKFDLQQRPLFAPDTTKK